MIKPGQRVEIFGYFKNKTDSQGMATVTDVIERDVINHRTYAYVIFDSIDGEKQYPVERWIDD